MEISEIALTDWQYDDEGCPEQVWIGPDELVFDSSVCADCERPIVGYLSEDWRGYERAHDVLTFGIYSPCCAPRYVCEDCAIDAE